jgi:cytochrome c oxidase subunit 2
MTPRARLNVRRNGVQPRKLSRRAFVATAVLLAAAAGLGVAPAAQEQGRHEITVTAKRYEFSPARIEVTANDVVKITLVAEDIPHTFTIDEYRISKRAAPGRPVTFEFRADKAGSFPFYCHLTIEDGCRQMRGELVVTPRRP